MNQREYQERLPGDPPLDETDASLRSYFSSKEINELRAYDSNWSDDEVIQWDGNFRSDGALMLICCERDVEIDEYREVLERFLKHANPQ